MNILHPTQIAAEVWTAPNDLLFNRQGEINSFRDQNGTVDSFDFDLLGRQTADRITTLGSGVDGAVLRISAAFEVRGKPQNVTSYDNATIGSGSVVNDVQRTYNSYWQLLEEYQSHSGAVNVSTTPKVQYAYADGSANTARPASMTYPNGRVLNYDYASVGGIADSASRIASLIDSDGVTHLADYSYLGGSAQRAAGFIPAGSGGLPTVASPFNPDTVVSASSVTGNRTTSRPGSDGRSAGRATSVAALAGLT